MSQGTKSGASQIFLNIMRWWDSEAQPAKTQGPTSSSDTFLRLLPFIILHIACLGALVTGVSGFAIAVCLGLYWLRMFAITGFYHRYFAHKAFKVNRFWQFIFAFIGNTSAQRGALWWAAHHRKHHQHSDQQQDPHSPWQSGFWYSHAGWFFREENFSTDHSQIREWQQYPELLWLNRYDSVAPIVLAIFLYGLGEILAATAPSLQTNGPQLLVWGFFISTTILFHSTVTINSLCHVWGHRRFNTKDNSRNNFFLALLTLGEGWHNNHHRYAGSARQGFVWWEIDITYYTLRLLKLVGIVYDLKPVPKRILEEHQNYVPATV